jgi:hypothetical protein
MKISTHQSNPLNCGEIASISYDMMRMRNIYTFLIILNCSFQMINSEDDHVLNQRDLLIDCISKLFRVIDRIRYNIFRKIISRDTSRMIEWYTSDSFLDNPLNRMRVSHYEIIKTHDSIICYIDSIISSCKYAADNLCEFAKCDSRYDDSKLLKQLSLEIKDFYHNLISKKV